MRNNSNYNSNNYYTTSTTTNNISNNNCSSILKPNHFVNCKFKLFIIFVFVLTFMLFATGSSGLLETVKADVAPYECYIDDAADFLTDAQEQSLYELMEQIANYGNVAFATSTSHSYSSSEQFAVSIFESRFYNNFNGVCFVIDRDLNQIYLISEGATRKLISNGRCNSITDNTYVYATSDYDYDYYTCAYETFSQVLTLLEGGKIAQPMKHICNLLLAIVLAMLFNYFITSSYARSKRPSNAEFLSGVFTKVDISHTSAHFTHQTRKYDPPSSSSSGGGGGGGGHSGGGHSI